MKFPLIKNAILVLFLVASAFAQERYRNGPYKGFLVEHPVLNTVNIPKLFRVSVVQGTIRNGDAPVGNLFFEVRDKAGMVFTAETDVHGSFRIPDVPAGTYDFKTTMDGFQSATGKVIVSHRAKDDDIELQVSIGY